MSKAKPVIAIVDDEECVLRAFRRLLESAGFDVRTFSSGAEFLESVRTQPPDCVVLDVHMPVMSGLEVQTRLAEASARVPVIVITGLDSPETRDRAEAAHASAYLRKPVDDRLLLDAMAAAIPYEKA